MGVPALFVWASRVRAPALHAPNVVLRHALRMPAVQPQALGVQMKTCTIEGCDKRHSGRGLCKMHATRVARHGSPHIVLKPKAHDCDCSVDGCFRPASAHGMCAVHRRRLRRNGHVAPTRNAGAFADYFTPGEAGACWPWRGTLDAYGYGRHADAQLAHRVAFETYVGPIPDGLVLDHLCRNTRCVNPAHLEAVTLAENTRRGLSGYAIRRFCKSGRHDITQPGAVVTNGSGRRTCGHCRSERATKRKAATQAAAA